MAITAYITDEGLSYDEFNSRIEEFIEWCRENLKSLIHCEFIDVSDTSLINDVMVKMVFEDEQEAMIAKLRWK